MAARRILVVGLGNFGPEYAKTRHNVGVLVVQQLAAALKCSAWRPSRDFSVCEAPDGGAGGGLVLLTPRTFMNTCGPAVRAALASLRVQRPDLIVVHDDLERELGKVSPKAGGSANGHNGVKSIAAALGSQEFRRVRVGIGRPGRGDAAGYVLGRFTPSETEALRGGVLAAAAKAVLEEAHAMREPE